MRVISKKTLVNFFNKHAASKVSLEAWYGEIVAQSFKKPEDIIKSYKNADVITGKRFVFNIKGNHYRLIADIEFKLQIVFIVWIGTHAEYDKINVEEVSYVKNN